MRKIAEVVRKVAEVMYFSKVCLSKMYFCEMYPTCVSSKLCEFICWLGSRLVPIWGVTVVQQKSICGFAPYSHLAIHVGIFFFSFEPCFWVNTNKSINFLPQIYSWGKVRNCAKPTKHDLPKCVRWFLFINSSSCYFGPDVRTATAFCCTTNQLLDLTEPANVAAARQGVQKPEVRTREGEDSSWSWPQTSSSKQATMCITVGFFLCFLLGSRLYGWAESL